MTIQTLTPTLTLPTAVRPWRSCTVTEQEGSTATPTSLEALRVGRLSMPVSLLVGPLTVFQISHYLIVAANLL